MTVEETPKKIAQLAFRSCWIGAAVGAVVGILLGMAIGYSLGSTTTVVIPLTEGIKT